MSAKINVGRISCHLSQIFFFSQLILLPKKSVFFFVLISLNKTIIDLLDLVVEINYSRNFAKVKKPPKSWSTYVWCQYFFIISLYLLFLDHNRCVFFVFTDYMKLCGQKFWAKIFLTRPKFCTCDWRKFCWWGKRSVFL